MKNSVAYKKKACIKLCLFFNVFYIFKEKRLVRMCRTTIDYDDGIIKLFYYIMWKAIYLEFIIHFCSSSRRNLDRCTAAVENVEPCAVGIVPFKEHFL